MKKYSKIKKILPLLWVLTIAFILIPKITHAQFAPLVPPSCYENGQCGVCEFFEVAYRFVQILFGLMGGTALVFFIWGGFGMITSGGNPEKITSNKKLMMSTVVGIMIMLLAWTAVNGIIVMLTGDVGAKGPGAGYTKILTGIGSQSWSEICTKQ
jgi:hypothetical protein